jgi:hypothetical protein
MLEDGLSGIEIGDGRDNGAGASAGGTDENVVLEHAGEELGPGKSMGSDGRGLAFRGERFLVRRCTMVRARRIGVEIQASADDLLSPARPIGEGAVVPHLVLSARRDQSCETAEKRDRLDDERGLAGE